MTQIKVCAHQFSPSQLNLILSKPCLYNQSYISALCLHTRKCSINMAQHSYALYMGTRLKTIPFAHAWLGVMGAHAAGGGGGHVKFAPLVCKDNLAFKIRCHVLTVLASEFVSPPSSWTQHSTNPRKNILVLLSYTILSVKQQSIIIIIIIF